MENDYLFSYSQESECSLLPLPFLCMQLLLVLFLVTCDQMAVSIESVLSCLMNWPDLCPYKGQYKVKHIQFFAPLKRIHKPILSAFDHHNLAPDKLRTQQTQSAMNERVFRFDISGSLHVVK